jgi:hypothetical protein
MKLGDICVHWYYAVRYKEQKMWNFAFLLKVSELANCTWYYKERYYVLDFLWGQPIKLIQDVSTSEFHEYWWNNVVFIFFCPLQIVQGLRSKNVK